MASSNSPCAACKFLRRKCTQDCVFAPYFPPDQPQKFANVHKVFGASNVTKLLNDLNPAQREAAVSSLAFEAEERLRDPVYGCVGSISILQKRLKQVQSDLNLAKKELDTYIGATTYMPQIQPTFANAGDLSYAMIQQQLLLQKQQQFSSAPMMGIPTSLAAGPSHIETSGGQLGVKEAQEHFAALAIPGDEDSIRNWGQQQQQYLRLNVSGSGYDATMSVGGINQVGSEALPSLALEAATFDQRAYNHIQSQQQQQQQQQQKQDESLSKQLLPPQATWQQQQQLQHEALVAKDNPRVCNYDQELQQQILVQKQYLYHREHDDRFKLKVMPQQRDGGDEDGFRGPAL